MTTGSWQQLATPQSEAFEQFEGEVSGNARPGRP